MTFAHFYIIWVGKMDDDSSTEEKWEDEKTSFSLTGTQDIFSRNFSSEDKRFVENFEGK